MNSTVAYLLPNIPLAVAIVLCAFYVMTPRGSDAEHYTTLLIIGLLVAAAVFDLLEHRWFGVASNSFTAGIWCLIWRRNRRNRKRSRESLGAKSRALIADLVERARESAQPRPVLRPVPGGAS